MGLSQIIRSVNAFFPLLLASAIVWLGGTVPSLAFTPPTPGRPTITHVHHAVAADCHHLPANDYEYILGLAKHGDARAQYLLSQLYGDPGYYKFLFSPVETPFSDAYRNLYYPSSRSSARNRREALTWLERSARSGYAKAQLQLAFYFEGRGSDYTAAAKWFRKAADQGNHTAQDNLSRMYKSGQGVSRDLRSAYFWALLASSGYQPNLYAWHGFVNDIAKRLTPSEVNAIQHAVNHWRPRVIVSDDRMPLFNVRALICGKPSWRCHKADTCGHYIGIACFDRRYYFADATTLSLFAVCGPWNGKGCNLPTQWTCGWPTGAPTQEEAHRLQALEEE